jgi:hypothetical protein
VAKEDLFEPDDLLQTYDIGRVYRNILALQCVAVSMSSRRSIDERSSLVGVNVMVREQSQPEWMACGSCGLHRG